jgi:hypothetical protein
MVTDSDSSRGSSSESDWAAAADGSARIVHSTKLPFSFAIGLLLAAVPARGATGRILLIASVRRL